jgi:DNA-binding transcriptional LysR family regulator
MDLSDLKIFSAVVREGSVTKAAQRLYRVQSNVTTRIRQLEEDIGVSLFIREGKRLHLSPAGQVLLEYADRLLALAEEARNAVQDPKPRGIFRLGAMESTADRSTSITGAIRTWPSNSGPGIRRRYQRRCWPTNSMRRW